MAQSWSTDDAKVLLYLSRKTGDDNEIVEASLNALKDFHSCSSPSARDSLTLWIQGNEKVSDALFKLMDKQIAEESHLETNLTILQGISRPLTVPASVMDTLWTILGHTEDSVVADKVSHIIALFFPTFKASNPPKFAIWWPEIVSCLTRTRNKLHVNAGLRAWFTVVASIDSGELTKVIIQNVSRYFDLLQQHVSRASKFALQTLIRSLQLCSVEIRDPLMSFDPSIKGVLDAWARYVSIAEILGVDTSVHQAESSLGDFVALLAPNSPIPPLWGLTLLTIGLNAANTEGIKMLTLVLVLSLPPSHMRSLVENPHYVAHELYPKILHTPNFVVSNHRCLHAEHLEIFTRNLMIAAQQDSIEAVRDIVYEMSQYFLRHTHSYEAPRVLIINAMLDALGPSALTTRETAPMLSASKATSLTYNSKAMADLYANLCVQLAHQAGDVSGGMEVDDVYRIAKDEIQTQGAVSMSSLQKLKQTELKQKGLEEMYNSLGLKEVSKPLTLLEALPTLQLMYLTQRPLISQDLVNSLLAQELEEPRALNAKERRMQSTAMFLAFELVHTATADACEAAFAAFTDYHLRLAALKAFKRSKPSAVPAEFMWTVWRFLQDETLRITERELHHEFIDILTTPSLVRGSVEGICDEIIDLSAHRRNLLVPLARGLSRFDAASPLWASRVLARILAYIRSEEYSEQLEELIALRFGVYEQNWGEMECNARVIASYHLSKHLQGSESLGDYILELAQLQEPLSGSLDNVEGRRRVLYYQALILLCKDWTKSYAMKVLETVRASLKTEASPPVRVHAEWLIALISYTHDNGIVPDFVTDTLGAFTATTSSPPRYIGSLIRIAMLLYFATDSPDEKLVDQLLPLSTSNKANVRHRAISALYIINKAGKSPSRLRDIIERVSAISEAGVQNSTYQNDSYLWDLKDIRLGPVCGGVSSRVYDRTMPDTLTTSDFAILGDVDIGPSWGGKPLREHDPAPLPETITAREKQIQEVVGQKDLSFSTQLQVKSAASGIDTRSMRTDLVVVASLCDKPVNLGAICRLSDALGVSRIAIRDKRVIADPSFKSTALTSEKWIPVDEVPEEGIEEYLRAKKMDGYTLVGIEQTDTSKRLSPTLQFPSKCVLMMGHERQGIPPGLLALLDACVEIEQRGYVRSMNIQTATAIVVHAYNHQNNRSITSVN